MRFGDSDNRRLRVNITMYLLMVAFVIVLVVLVRLDLIQEKERERVRQEVVEQTEGQERAARAKGQVLYQQTLAQLEEAFPGIVCWGDSLTLGNRSGSVPKNLKAKINSEVCASLRDDLRSKTGLYSTSDLELRVEQMGVTGEGLQEILARSGALTPLLAEEVTIPASTDRVEVGLTDPSGEALHFANQSHVRFGTVTIQGVAGALYRSSSSSSFLFGRESAGEKVQVPARSPVQLESGQAYRNLLPVVCLNEPAEADAITPEAFVSAIRSIVSHHTSPSGEYVVLCHTQKDSSYDLALATAFGAHYIRVEKASTSADFSQLAKEIYEYLDGKGLFDKAKKVAEEAIGKLSSMNLSN